ncbi:hypothetical protein ACOI1C_16230 [Bacillus sp. DJP31]|uniref:hypothetical protein n=1 Tax=Bacillus sp. DJP31 TaxID=3409789 RepID=UPI003BB66D8A
MFCIREERRDELTKKFEAIFAGLFEHPLIANPFFISFIRIDLTLSDIHQHIV